MKSIRGHLSLFVILFSSSIGAIGITDAPPIDTQKTNNELGAPSTQANTEKRFFVGEYRIKGGDNLLPKLEVEEAVYPYLGPYRTPEDIEQARAALEKAYRDKGFQTVTVQIPQQQVHGGVIFFQVVPAEVGRLRVTGSRYFSPDRIKNEVPSLAEGSVPDFNAVSREIVGINQLPDRQVTVVPHPGAKASTYDIDLNVKDAMPLHGSLEVNNRYSADTTPLRINGSVSYNNLWQMGHTIGGSFQVSPEDISQVKVFSGYYLAHVPDTEWLSLMLEGTKQDSNVSTLGGIGVAGKGDVIGLRAIISLPQQKDFYHSVSLGVDYKHYDQDLTTAGTISGTPITYYPLSAAYSVTWLGKGYETDFNGAVDLHLRGMGSSQAEFDNNRHGADGSFVYFRGDASHTRDLPGGLQVFGKVQGQAADQPLVNNEQFSGGGLGTVRGYLESEELGDNALLGSMELRSPSLSGLFGSSVDEWRFYLFGEGGLLTINDPLAEQKSNFRLASVGAGTRVRLLKHLNGSLDFGVPLSDATTTSAYDMSLTFRVWAEF